MKKSAKQHHRRLAALVRRFRGQRVGVLGDFMYDEFLRGDARRLSPEAPVPVVLIENPKAVEGYAGGAGNVVANIAALGGRPVPFGAVGKDEAGKRLRDLLQRRGIPTEGLVQDGARVTPRKVRIVAHQHQLLRLDVERADPLTTRTAAQLARHLERWIGKLDALVISDYQKGCVSTELAGRAISLSRQKRLPVLVDPKPQHPEICWHSTLATPNLHEAEMMLGRPFATRQSLLDGGRRLLAELGCANLLITRGAEGMTLFEENGSVYEIHGRPRPVYDVTGAGDTVLAVLAMALCAGGTLAEAVELANRAGGRVVLKFGTAEITTAELMESLAGKENQKGE